MLCLSMGNGLTGLGPFTHEVTQLLRLSNPNSDPIAFKVGLLMVSRILGMMLTWRNVTGQNHCSKTVRHQSKSRRIPLTAVSDTVSVLTLVASSLVAKLKCKVDQEQCGM